MASISVNPGVADLLQTLSSGVAGSLSPILSSSAVQSVLKIAAPADLVHLSQEAQQLVVANGLFATSGASQTVTDPAALLIQAVNSSLSGSTSTPASGASQLQLMSELFGTIPTAA
jgi:hypothetical protein